MDLNIAELEYLVRLVAEDKSAAIRPPSLFKKLEDALTFKVRGTPQFDKCTFAIIGAYVQRASIIKLYRTLTGAGLRDSMEQLRPGASEGLFEIVVQSNTATYQNAVERLPNHPGVNVVFRF